MNVRQNDPCYQAWVRIGYNPSPRPMTEEKPLLLLSPNGNYKRVTLEINGFHNLQEARVRYAADSKLISKPVDVTLLHPFVIEGVGLQSLFDSEKRWIEKNVDHYRDELHAANVVANIELRYVAESLRRKLRSTTNQRDAV